jgi:hypothetical protein
MKGDKGLAPFFIFSALTLLALSELHLCRARFHPHINIANVIIHAASLLYDLYFCWL